MNERLGAAAWAAVVVLGLSSASCGGSDPVEDEVVEEEETAGSEQNGTDDDGVGITGLMGTIRRDQVENALNPRMPRFMRCFSQRMGDVEYLAGDIRMSFRIHTDGSVAWVFPAESDIGDRPTEQCVLEVARGTRFPRPQGGEAEFNWGFGMDGSEDVRPPLNWQADALGEQADEIAGLARECGARGPYQITAYIEPEGAVLAAGGSMPDAESVEALDCILERVREMTMPDPGSYAAKITFEVR